MSARFSAPAPANAGVKMALFGPPGSGKTLTALLFSEGLAAMSGKRIAFVDTEHGTDLYMKRIPERAVHPEPFQNVDMLYTRSLAETVEACDGLDPNVYGVVVIDSISHIWQAAQDAFDGKRVGKRNDKIQFQDWDTIKRPYKRLVDFLNTGPMHMFILGRQKNTYEEIDGELKKVGVAMKAEGETAYEPTFCLRMETVKDQANPRRTMVIAEVDKDRSGILKGRQWINPDFETIKPLLPYLCDAPAAVEDEEERIAKDGELIEDAEQRAAKKSDKSAGLLANFQGEILSAPTVEALGKIGEAIKKQKRYMLAEHVAALLEVYKSRRDTIVNALTGGMS